MNPVLDFEANMDVHKCIFMCPNKIMLANVNNSTPIDQLYNLKNQTEWSDLLLCDRTYKTMMRTDMVLILCGTCHYCLPLHRRLIMRHGIVTDLFIFTLLLCR